MTHGTNDELMAAGIEKPGGGPVDDHATVDMTAGEFGDRAVLDRDLTAESVPISADPWMPFAEFALSFDGYLYRRDLGDWANGQLVAFVRLRGLPDNLTLPDLRALVFYEQRRFRHLDVMPVDDAAVYIEALLAQIRGRLGGIGG